MRLDQYLTRGNGEGDVKWNGPGLSFSRDLKPQRVASQIGKDGHFIDNQTNSLPQTETIGLQPQASDERSQFRFRP